MNRSLVVVGQGYVGLPVSMLAVQQGFTVVGVDVDASKVALLARGVSPIEDIEDDEVEAALKSGRYRVVADYSSLPDFATAVITVPTPLRDAGPDLSFLESACEALAPRIAPGCTVVVESTTYPGTTQDVVAPLLEKCSGMKAGRDFFVGFSPERIDPGNTTWTLRNTPKIISGINEKSLSRVREFYASLVDETVAVPSPREAEMAKLLENTFRHVNIALVNELLIMSRELGIDPWSSIDAAATKPFGFMKFEPGPGVGGHCLPIDPTYLAWEVRRQLGRSSPFIELANEVNAGMPRYVVERIQLLLNGKGRAVRDSKVLVLGLAYKRNSRDTRESPAIKVVERLKFLGANVRVADPVIKQGTDNPTIDLVEFCPETVADAHLIVILTDHDAFDFNLLKCAEVPVLDTRRRLQGFDVPELTFL